MLFFPVGFFLALCPPPAPTSDPLKKVGMDRSLTAVNGISGIKMGVINVLCCGQLVVFKDDTSLLSSTNSRWRSKDSRWRSKDLDTISTKTLVGLGCCCCFKHITLILHLYFVVPFAPCKEQRASYEGPDLAKCCLLGL